MFDKRIYEFRCNSWLSGQDGDRKTYRDLKMDRERGFVEGKSDILDCYKLLSEALDKTFLCHFQ